MNDISKCDNDACRLKETCKRHMMKGEFQWFSTFEPYLDIDGYWYCEFYLEYETEN